MADPLTIGLSVASIISSIVGNVLQGEAAEESMDKQLKLKQTEIDAQLKIAADRLKVDYKQLAQAKDLYIQNLRETARQFDSSMQLKSGEQALQAGQFNQTMDLAQQKFNLEKRSADVLRRGRAGIGRAFTPVPGAPGPSPQPVV